MIYSKTGREIRLRVGLVIPKGSYHVKNGKWETFDSDMIVKKSLREWNNLTQNHDGGHLYLEKIN